MEEWPSRNLICSRSPPDFLQSLAQVRRRSWAPNRSIPISFADCSDHGPNRPVAQALADLPDFGDRSQESALLYAGSGHPDIDSLLEPDRDRDRTNASSLPFEIGQHPAAFPQLDGLDFEGEADLIRLRTREGMKIARAKGKLRGKQPKLSEKQQKELTRMYTTGKYSISDLAELFSISRPTVYRTLLRNTG